MEYSEQEVLDYIRFRTSGMCMPSRRQILSAARRLDRRYNRERQKVITLLAECKRMQARIDEMEQAPIAVDWPVSAEKVEVQK